MQKHFWKLSKQIQRCAKEISFILQKQYNKLHEQFLESKEGAGKSKRKLSDCCFVHMVFGHKHMKTR